METKEKIKETALEKVTRFGVRSVTMDDIARGAGVSKKTIYQEFGDKEQLLFEIFEEQLNKDACAMDNLFQSSESIIVHLLEMSKFIRSRFTHMHPMVLNEIERYYPRCWQQFEFFKQEHGLKGLVRLLEAGKREGLFRKEINSELLATFRMEQVSITFDPIKFPPEKFNMLEVQMQLLDLFIFGILTEKGKEEYLEHVNNQDREI